MNGDNDFDGIIGKLGDKINIRLSQDLPGLVVIILLCVD